MTRRERSSTLALLTTLMAFAVEVRGAGDPRSLRGSALASPARRIVVSLAECKLALVEGERVVKVYRTAVGASKTPSPTGSFQIINRISNPTYYAPGKVIPARPANPLGTRWLGLSLHGYGIHGTNQPKSIGRAASHGCIRLRNQDVEELFQFVRPGDQVEIFSESSPELARVFSKKEAANPAAPASSLGSPQSDRN